MNIAFRADAERYFAEAISLPMYPMMTDEEHSRCDPTDPALYARQISICVRSRRAAPDDETP